MKSYNISRFFCLLVLQFLITFAAQASALAISDWEPSIPLSQATTIELVAEKADIFRHEDDDTGVACGGETTGYRLADYYTLEDYEGNITHELKVQFLVTVPVHYCEGEALQVCELSLETTFPPHVSVGAMVCSEI